MTDLSLDPSLHDLLEQRAWLADLAQALLRNPHSAADAAQETWLQTLCARGPLRDARAWLSTVLANVVRQGRRGETRRREREQARAGERATSAEAAADANERFELQRTVAAAVNALEEPFRGTVLLHHFEGLTLAAIARSEGVPAGTVRWRLHRAHALLREQLERTCGRDWRGALGLLCAPLRRAAMTLGPALLLASMLAVAATVWAVSGFANEAPPPGSTALAGLPVNEKERDTGTPDAVRSGRDELGDAEVAAAPAAPLRERRMLVRARIVDANGVPIAGSSLRLSAAEFRKQQAPAEMLAGFAPPATAGADGAIALPLRVPGLLVALLPEGGGELIAAGTFTASAPGHDDEKVEVFLADGDDRSLGTITLHAIAGVDGRVVDERGNALPGVRVCAQRPPFAAHPEVMAGKQHAPDGGPETIADPTSGAFALAGVRLGPTLVWASKPGFVSAWRLVDVAGPRTRCDDLVLRPAAAPPLVTARQMRVRVVDERDAPVNARIGYSASYTNGLPLRGAWHSSDGTCTVPSMGNASLASLQLWVSSTDPTLACVAVLAPPLDADEIRVVLPPGDPFVVRARDADGAPLRTFWVVFEPAAPAAGGPPGVNARPQEGAQHVGVATLATPCVAGTFVVCTMANAQVRVPFVPGTTSSPLEVTFAPLRGITGVVTAGGKPVQGADVALLHVRQEAVFRGFRSAGTLEATVGSSTDDTGRFRIYHDAAEPLILQVCANGFAPALSERRDYEPAHGWNDLAIELGGGGAIEGVVRDRAGEVQPRAIVAVHDFHGDARTVLADANGRFRFDHRRAGDHEVRGIDKLLDPVVTTHFAIGADHGAPHSNCAVRDGEVTRFDVIVDRCRLVGALRAHGFVPRGWSAHLVRAHDGLAACANASLRGDGSFTLSSDSDGPHVLLLSAPGGPLGNVTLRVPVELVAGDTTVDVPLALAPFTGRADGAVGLGPDGLASLRQEHGLLRVTTAVHVDPTTLRFTAPLAPVGDVVLMTEGNREVGRFAVAPK
jgi:RNA polymerase sigma factor (sigma-70 family)